MIKHYLTVFLISMVPIAELRAAIPYSQAVGLQLIPSYVIAIIGNMLPVPVIYLFARKVLEIGSNMPSIIGKFCRWCTAKGEKGGEKLQTTAGRKTGLSELKLRKEYPHMESRELAKQICEALADKKGEDIKILNISEVTVLADYFIIASGSNRNQVQAMADNVEETLGKLGHEPKQIEGYQSGNWILMDYQDVIVHIFDNENRLFYDLERIWRDGKSLTVEEL